jgi:hypothetical protein
MQTKIIPSLNRIRLRFPHPLIEKNETEKAEPQLKEEIYENKGKKREEKRRKWRS